MTSLNKLCSCGGAGTCKSARVKPNCSRSAILYYIQCTTCSKMTHKLSSCMAAWKIWNNNN